MTLIYCLSYRFEPLDEDSFRTLQQSLISYVQSEYVYGSAESNASCMSSSYIDPFRNIHNDLQIFATSSRIHSHYSSYAHTSNSGQHSSPIFSLLFVSPSLPPSHNSIATSRFSFSTSYRRSLVKLQIKQSSLRGHSTLFGIRGTLASEMLSESEMRR